MKPNTYCFYIFLLTRYGSHCQVSILDSFLGPFRAFQLVSKTILVNKDMSRLEFDIRLQPEVPKHIKFPCHLNNTKSKTKPVSVHRLRPGDIDVIGAMGDSLTAGNGLKAFNYFHLYSENRGISFSSGGEDNWRKFLTLPNILKEFNPNLIGYALRDSVSTEHESQFNVAEMGAISENTPYMAKVLVKRILNDPRINVRDDWKMISFMIGPNDFCSEICYYKNPEDVLERHRNDLIKVLMTLKQFLPRTIVNVIPPPNLRIITNFTNKSLGCVLLNIAECPCLFALQFNKFLQKYDEIMEKWQRIDVEVSNQREFHGDDFTVVVQPFTLNYKFPVRADGNTDYTYLSTDCFHFSQKGNARVANSLWNNILEPVGKKDTFGVDLFSRINCPTSDRPYIFTNENSRMFYNNYN